MFCHSCQRNIEGTAKMSKREPCGHLVCNFCKIAPNCGVCEKNKRKTEKDSDFRKVYVGNLPFATTKDELRKMFSICGEIRNVSVYKFKDEKGIQRAYGFVEFADPSAARNALHFNKKTCKHHVLTVMAENKYSHAVYVKNIPKEVNAEMLKEFFKAYGVVKYVKEDSPTTAFINFADEGTRRKVLAQQIKMPGSTVPLSIELKEPKQQLDTSSPPQGQQFTLYISKVPNNLTNEDLRSMFELAGPIVSTNIKNDMGKEYGAGFVNYATAEARETAMEFNGEQPNGWSIKLSLFDQEKKEGTSSTPSHPMPPPPPLFPYHPQFGVPYGIPPLIQAPVAFIPPSSRLQQFVYPHPHIHQPFKAQHLQQGIPNKAQPAQQAKSAQRATPALQAQSAQRATSALRAKSAQQANVDRRFSVKIIGFGDDVHEEDLKLFFRDAGRILDCSIKQTKEGGRIAFINYEKEEDVRIAISYSDCFIGSPSKQIKVENCSKPPKASAFGSTSNLAGKMSLEQLNKSTSQLSLNGTKTFRVIVDNVPKHLTSANIQSLFADCGTIVSPPEIVFGADANMARIFFAQKAFADKAKKKRLPGGADGDVMTVM